MKFQNNSNKGQIIKIHQKKKNCTNQWIDQKLTFVFSIMVLEARDNRQDTSKF